MRAKFAGTSPGRWRLTARSASGGTESSTGSLNSTAPAATTADPLSPKLTARPLPATIAGPVSRNPTCVAPMASGRLP
ncbi:MAG: hypothetical protein FJW39_33560 [Acidobacteria bacterium]|nr:hypothetical protein [Acidobacteriota bacterium]